MEHLQKEDWVLCLATGFGLGALPKIPGTWGSLGALPLWFIFAGSSNSLYLFLVLIISGLAIFIADAAGKIFTGYR